MAEIQNPNQSGGGGQDSRTLLIFAVIFVAAYFGMRFFVKKPADTTQTTPATISSPAPVQKAGSSPSSSAPPARVSALSPAAVAASGETKTVVENDLYRITFSNRGGQAVSWILKKYKDADAKNPLDL